MLGVRLDKDLERRLSALAEKTHRSKSYLAKEALKLYLAQEEAKEREKAIALARWEEFQRTGKSASNEDVMEWLDSWGTDQEKPWTGK
ncbi:ribbon-helix-helix protein, CopG family [uncultured Microbulbifer sp.]|uniref:CopG family ribbon-helix-helix protein n=1 Tax=uncultured Microbulbifer sp. TaxID=348147 RepID=UPI0025E8AE11|nr:ribbon-helix-helix protein, CopG family [uncultured Microbulbifer sp.]